MDLLIQKIKDKTGISVTALRQTIKQHQDEQAVDWPLMVAQAVVANSFKGYLILNSDMFWGYTGTHWKVHSDNAIKHELLEIGKRIVPADDFDAEAIIRKGYTVIKSMCAIDVDVLSLKKVPPPIINLKNGELHIHPRTGEVTLKSHNPKSYLTHCLDIEYDPDAKCPQYDNAVRSIFCGREDLVRHYHEVAGYIIQPTRNFKNFFMCYGRKGNNGKSSLFRTLTSIVGKDNVAFKKMSSFGESKHDTSALVGKIMLLDDDFDKGAKLSDGLIKQLSEQKDITVEYKRKDHFEIVAYAAVVILSNHWPTTTDLTDAMISRAMIIPFDAHFSSEGRDRYLFDRIIQTELPGVLNELLAGLKRLFVRDDWDLPIACEEAKKRWLGDTSNLYSFISEMLVEEPDSFIYSKELRISYENWCREEGIQDRYMVQNRKLKSSIQDLGLELSERTNNNMGKWKIIGYKLVDPTVTVS